MKLDIQQIRQMITAQFANADLSLAGIRAAMDATGAAAPMPAGVRVEATDVGVPGEWITPDEVDGSRTLLYFHGGGYMAGSLLSSRNQAARIAVASRAKLLSISYRLAPENPFPAAVDDALVGYRALREQGVAASDIGLVGGSAGGGLALALALRVRDEEPTLGMPAAVAALSAWMDLGCGWDSLQQAQDPLCQHGPVVMMAQAYLAGQSHEHPLASPLHADLAGLPPLLIQVGGAEGLRDEGEAFAKKAREAGVDVRFEEWPEMIHNWHVFAPMLDEATGALDQIGGFLRETVGR